jgi:hypothetical protein
MIEAFQQLSTVLGQLDQSFNNIGFLKTLQEGGQPVEIKINTDNAIAKIDDLTSKIDSLVSSPKEILLSVKETSDLVGQLQKVDNLVKTVS